MRRIRQLARALAPACLFALSLSVVATAKDRFRRLGEDEPRPAANTGRAGLVALAGPRLRAAAPNLPARTLERALTAYERALARGLTTSSVLTIIDYGLPSTAKRLWVLDVGRGLVLFNELVAHGKRTGENLARAFSNRPGSNQSSLGAFLTGGTYIGRHGLSLRLKGLEPGINDQAEARAIVIHAAAYVNEDLARKLGRLGRSQGCPAVRPEVAADMIRTIQGGTFLYAYYPDTTFERRSTYLN